jgi:hypothetical protein
MVLGCGTKILVSNETDGESHYFSKKNIKDKISTIVILL